MTDLAAPIADTGASTTLEPNAPAQTSGGGAVTPPDEEPKEPASLRDTIADEMNKGDKPEAKEEKPADDTKPAKAKDDDGEAKGEEKPKAKADTEPKEKTDDVKAEKQPDSEARNAKPDDDDGKDKPGHYQPPKNFLPDSREKWTNVPRAVQRDIDNMTREHQAKVEQLSKATERYEAIREYDELAQSNGRELRESLQKMGEIEDGLQKNPVATLNRILIEAGPRKPDGSPVSLFEVAKWIVGQGEQGYQKVVAAKPANDPQPNQEVEQLKQQIAQMQTQQTTAAIIEPFKAQHPRYEELKGDIAMFLKSGKIPPSLSPSDRLAAAYDMAERVNPSSNVDSPAATANPDAEARVEENSSGTKSIKSAPGSVSPDNAPKRGGSTADILRDELRRTRRA